MTWCFRLTWIKDLGIWTLKYWYAPLLGGQHPSLACTLIGPIRLPSKVHISQSYIFSSSHVQMWELDYKEGWMLKNWYFWIVVLEKTLEGPLDSKEIKPVNPKGIQPWIFIGRTDAEAPIFWPPDVKSWLTGKDSDIGKGWKQKEKGVAEDEMVG